MVNSELKNNGPDNSGTGTSTFHKQSPITTKKTVLADVQNEGRPIADMIKVCETKRLIPECPSSHSFPPTLTKPAAKEHLTDTRTGEAKSKHDEAHSRASGRLSKLD